MGKANKLFHRTYVFPAAIQSFKILALLALTDSGEYVKFTTKYTIVGGEKEGGELEFFKGSNLLLLVTQEPM